MRCAVLFFSLVAVLFTASPGWSQTPTLAELAAQVSALQSTVATLTRYIKVIETASTSSYNGLTGPHVIFRGANVHIQSGSGVTHKARRINEAWVNEAIGLGNLIIGYNEADTGDATQRGGSHNLVVGVHHQYPNSGGLVAGSGNAISGRAASVSGGTHNAARGDYASVSGGDGNIARGDNASVSGGHLNEAHGGKSSVSGGQSNKAHGGKSSVSGGKDNEARNNYSSVSGGRFNKAIGPLSSVSGGRANTASGHWASVLGGHRNTASSTLSSVSGGDGLTVTAAAADLSYLWPACLTTEAVTGQTKANVVFEGCNVHIRNGHSTEQTATINGRGNLIVGYNEASSGIPVIRDGSHNVVIGPEHEYTSHSGVVVGFRNDITGAYSSVSGGRDNVASGEASSVSGGVNNLANGSYSSVSGGERNTAGLDPTANASGPPRATGESASVSGGYNNRASGRRSSISGGQNQIVNDDL